MTRESLIETLRLIEQDEIWWYRHGASPAYREHVIEVKQLIRMGLVIVRHDGCCYKYYLITDAGENILKRYEEESQ